MLLSPNVLIALKEFAPAAQFDNIVPIPTTLLVLVLAVHNAHAHSRVYLLQDAHLFYPYRVLWASSHAFRTDQDGGEDEVVLFGDVVPDHYKMSQVFGSFVQVL